MPSRLVVVRSNGVATLTNAFVDPPWVLAKLLSDDVPLDCLVFSETWFFCKEGWSAAREAVKETVVWPWKMASHNVKNPGECVDLSLTVALGVIGTKIRARREFFAVKRVRGDDIRGLRWYVLTGLSPENRDRLSFVVSAMLTCPWTMTEVEEMIKITNAAECEYMFFRTIARTVAGRLWTEYWGWLAIWILSVAIGLPRDEWTLEPSLKLATVLGPYLTRVIFDARGGTWLFLL